MTFADIRKAGFDTETTGTDPNKARIVTAAIVLRGPGLETHTITWLINPGVPIPPETTAIHGIGDAKAQADGQDPKTALDEIADHLVTRIWERSPIVAYNLAYDWTVLDRELCRHSLPTMADRLKGWTDFRMVDPLVIDRHFAKFRSGSRKLGRVCEVHGVELKDWHAADADALAAVMVAEAQFARYPELAAMPPSSLFEKQQVWHREWAADFQTYKRRSDPTVVIDGSWPLQPHPELVPHQPARGDAVEQWLKAQRDAHLDGYNSPSPEWHALDRVLDDYRLHADTGTPLGEHACEGGNHDDCSNPIHSF
jgi:DNA polymerase-3 subunit epsilon